MTRRILIAAAAALVFVTSASAAGSGPVFGIRGAGNPKLGYFVYDLGTSQSVTGAVIVSNTGNEAGVVKLYAVDGTTGRTTGTVYETSTPPRKQGTWVTLADSTLKLPAGTHEQVPFTVHVPAGQAPGQWVAGIVAETTHQSAPITTKHKASVHINVRNLTIIAVQVNVPGHQTAAFHIGNVTTGGQNGFQQVYVHIANTGSLLRKPTGQVVIAKTGSVVETLPFRMDTFLPKTAIDYPLLLRKALSPGSYQARITLSYPNQSNVTQTVTATPSFSVSKTDVTKVFKSAAPTQQAAKASGGSSSSTPWLLVAILVAILAVGAVLVAVLLRRRRGEPAASAAVTPAAAPGACASEGHRWEADAGSGAAGADGVWRSPHRCRVCGLAVHARDAADATAEATRLGH